MHNKSDSMRRRNTAAVQSESAIPDFCDNYVLLILMLTAEALAIVLTLSQPASIENRWFYLGNISLFIQTIALLDAALLCLLRRKIHRLAGWRLYILLYILLQLITAVVTIAAYHMLDYIGLKIGGDLNLAGQLIKNVCISTIITGAMLRYFYVQHQNAIQQRSEGEARIQALQARIRPHFLFNSLNTIANLIHREPEDAEEALIDLAELFRSTLGKQAKISLQDELEIVRRYLRIEQLRLGDRLKVDWDIPPALSNITVPALILQPLIENAIYHGIEPLADGGRVKILAQKQSGEITIEIHNPLATDPVRLPTQGNQVAIDNIRQRLALAYGGDARLEQRRNDVHYTVIITLPISADSDASSNR